ncbi:MAG: Phosphoglycerate kinase [Clostridia bacterium 41_269]|nr:MAG: Phosphoglycerate kinase [Clostridia bacterium 41_269]
MPKKTIRDLDVRSKRVLVRVDFNVPLKDGTVLDDTRIQAALPTIQYLIDSGAKVILMSHLGRPKGKPDPAYKMDPVARRLEELLGRKVKKIDFCVGPEAEKAVGEMAEGDVLLLENTRFYPGETSSDPEFARELASLGDIFVNDAFGAAHRAHASTYGVAEYLPTAAGFLMEKEISIMDKILKEPERPLTAVVGGAKIADKMSVLLNFMNHVDYLVIGGGVANTFLKAMGYEVGKSLVEDEKILSAQEIIDSSKMNGVKLFLPEDVVIAKEIDPNAETKVVPVDSIPKNMMVLDIGPKTAKKYSEIIRSSNSAVWVGPMGVFEYDAFAGGTKAVAEAVASVPYSLVGGGDSAAAAEKMGVADRITHISTGGGASLKYLGGEELPGITVIMEKDPDKVELKN